MGMIFDIQRGCTDDGPGIRTTVFLKGCPLNCLWCHNPESKNPYPQKYTDGTKTVGYECTVDEIMKTVLADRKYYQASGGGMTLSGGEPLMQPEFSWDLLKEAGKNDIHTCVETSGYSSEAVLDGFLGATDLFLFDIKAPPSSHRELTGAGSERILSNLEYLYRNKAKILLRCPIIPTKNDTEEHFAYLKELQVRFPDLAGMQLMPYHNLGVDKGRRLGLNAEFSMDNPSREQIDQWREKTGIKL